MRRPPKPFFERAKLVLLIVSYIALSEWADPFPYHVTLPAKIAVALLLLVILRELHHARAEVDPDWAGRARRIERKARAWAALVDERTWLRLQRLAVWAASLWLFGAVLNAITDRCDSAPQCVILAPRMAAENLPAFVQFMVFVSLTIAQIAVMLYALVKVGSYKLVMPGTVETTFDDVWGQDLAKAKVLEQVQLLEDSREVERAGGYMPKGILLYGPPGTGKTLLAKAAANYSSKPLLLVPPGAWVSTFWGVNLLKVWMLFRHTRKLARRYGGVIVFIDEIDSLGSRGAVMGASPPEPARGCVQFSRSSPRRVIVTGGAADMGTLQAFLAAMDGMDEPRGLINRLLVFCGFRPLRPPRYKYLMIGATNRVDALDPALLRAGRFGRKIHVDYPSVEGRLRTYEGYLARVQHTLSPSQIEWAARHHDRGTGAEIADIVNEALLVTYRVEGRTPGTITYRDLVDAMLWVRHGESEGPFQRDEARWQAAVHEAGHAVAFHLLARDWQEIWIASIERRGATGGIVVPTSLRDDWLMTREEMMAELQITLASRVAEEIMLGTTTNGNAGDAEQATRLAQQMVALGHAGQIGVYPSDEEDVRERTEAVLREALEGCRQLLADRGPVIREVALRLARDHTVPGDVIHELIEWAERR